MPTCANHAAVVLARLTASSTPIIGNRGLTQEADHEVGVHVTSLDDAKVLEVIQTADDWDKLWDLNEARYPKDVLRELATACIAHHVRLLAEQTPNAGS